jgi:thiol-disulfide isomerase/thioredoxin
MTAAALAAAPSFALAQETGIMLGVDAPPAAVSTLGGQPANLSQHIGKGPVVMYFWATWCPVCKALTPKLITIADKYAGKVTLVNVAVSVNQSPALAQRYATAHKMVGAQYYDTKGNATEVYDVPATSYVVVIDKGGKVVYTGIGEDQGPKIEAVLRKLVP